MFPEINRFYFKVAVFTYKWSTFILCHAFLLLTLICFFRNFSLIFKRLLLAFDSDQLSQIFLLALFISHFIFVSETVNIFCLYAFDQWRPYSRNHEDLSLVSVFAFQLAYSPITEWLISQLFTFVLCW